MQSTDRNNDIEPTERSRTVGFELEFAGVGLARAADIIQELFGGRIEKHSQAELTVNDTKLGSFRLELDAEPIKKLSQFLESQDNSKEPLDSLYQQSAQTFSRAVNEAGAKIVPYEIVMPPVSISKISEMDKIRARLCDASAKGTREAFYYAFGLHINPEIEEESPEYLLAHIRAFSLLEPWLNVAHDVDVTRKLSPFVEAYPKAYLHHIFTEGYRPNLDQLIQDYHYYNPSRNKALDMLPVFAHLNNDLVRKLYGPEEKINARPTFHYRLPNCDLSDPNWSLLKEWELWLKIEKLASYPAQMSELFSAFMDTEKRNAVTLLHNKDEYVTEVQRMMDGCHAA
ncbi:MAG: amidoligase family protein [Alphaproteobacteria bacterium]|nr:amidoligase family protein [Alphaproteobacteria bacterium]